MRQNKFNNKQTKTKRTQLSAFFIARLIDMTGQCWLLWKAVSNQRVMIAAI